MATDNAVFRLRPDIGVVRRESETGAPSLLLHDPLAETFDKVEWPESDLVLLLRKPTTEASLLADFTEMNTLAPKLQDIGDYVREMEGRGLVVRYPPSDRTFQPERRRSWLRSLAGLMFFQIPLLYPATFLKNTATLAKLVLNPLVASAFLVAGIIGAALMLPRFAEFARDGFGVVRMGSVVFLMAAVVFSKTIHEFAHAYRATLAGSRVKTMGVAFFFGVPFPFTDVTDAWRLEWRDRLSVAAAGLHAELALAGGALLVWSLAPPGDAKIALARLSSVALLSTILTNLNPGPRFDGYYILTCLLRTDNLRGTSTGLLRRVLYGRVFGLAIASPDGDNIRTGPLLAYAVYAVLYRLGLGFGLVAMAYHFLPKAFGLPVAGVLALLFFVMPVMGEVLFLWRRRSRMRITGYFVSLLLVLAAAGIWFFGEWPRRIAFPAVTRAGREEAVRSRREGVVAEILTSRGQDVKAGDILIRLSREDDAPVLQAARQALREAELAEEQAFRGDENYRYEATTRTAETARRRDEVAAVEERSRLLDIPAPVSGRVVQWDEALAVGVHVGGGRTIGWIVAGDGSELSCYPEMADVGRLDPDAPVRFIPDDGGVRVDGRVFHIDPARLEILEDAALGSVLGAVMEQGALHLPEPYARVRVRLDTPVSRIGQTGQVWTRTRPESYARRTLLWLRSLAVRESAF